MPLIHVSADVSTFISINDSHDDHQTERIGTIHDGKRTFTITITITITVKILYSACSQKVSRGLRRRVYINIEQKVHVLR